MKLYSRKLKTYTLKSYLYPWLYKRLSLHMKKKVPIIEIQEFNKEVPTRQGVRLTKNEFIFLIKTFLFKVNNIKILNNILIIIPLSTGNINKYCITKYNKFITKKIILNQIELNSLLKYQCELFDKLELINN
jgi:hypothetical protein